MDLLRTQRVRKLTNYYNCLKANNFTDKTKRLKFMEEILDVLKCENNCAIFEVMTNDIHFKRYKYIFFISFFIFCIC